MSAAKPLAVSYRRDRSFSSAFMTTQSRSLRSSAVSLLGSVPRFADKVGRASAVLSLELGLGGSSSRTTRRISSSPFFSSSFRAKGRAPVSSSYNNTPSEYTSVRVSMSRLLNVACSGDMYCGVPTSPPNPVLMVWSVSGSPVALATPKSITFGTGFSS